MIKVWKFGGTSVGSAERMKHVAKLIADGDRKIVVLSAMSGTTNALVEIGSLYLTGKKSEALQAISVLKSKYHQEIEVLLGQNSEKDEAKLFIEARFEKLMAFSKGVFSHKEEKEVLAEGEIWSTHLFHFYFKSIGTGATLLQSLDFMQLNAEGEPDKVLIQKKLTNKLQDIKSQLIVCQGFVCRNVHGEIDNLKRGGSDYSASLIGEALQADEIQIWTDIDGLHNNDPRYVQNTRPINHISFDEAAELAYFGAKILHPASIQPAKNKNIPVWLKNTMQPEANGTLIDSNYNAAGFKAIAAKDGILAIKVKSSRMLLAYGFLRKVFEVFEKYHTPIDMITTSEVAVSLTIDDESYLKEIIRELQPFGEVEIDRNQSIVCIVGNFIAENVGMASQVFDSIKNIPLRMISYGGSRHNISLLINSEDKKQTLQALHRVFEY